LLFSVQIYGISDYNGAGELGQNRMGMIEMWKVFNKINKQSNQEQQSQQTKSQTKEMEEKFNRQRQRYFEENKPVLLTTLPEIEKLFEIYGYKPITQIYAEYKYSQFYTSFMQNYNRKFLVVLNNQTPEISYLSKYIAVSIFRRYTFEYEWFTLVGEGIFITNLLPYEYEISQWLPKLMETQDKTTIEQKFKDIIENIRLHKVHVQLPEIFLTKSWYPFQLINFFITDNNIIF